MLTEKKNVYLYFMSHSSVLCLCLFTTFKNLKHQNWFLCYTFIKPLKNLVKNLLLKMTNSELCVHL